MIAPRRFGISLFVMGASIVACEDLDLIERRAPHASEVHSEGGSQGAQTATSFASASSRTDTLGGANSIGSMAGSGGTWAPSSLASAGSGGAVSTLGGAPNTAATLNESGGAATMLGGARSTSVAITEYGGAPPDQGGAGNLTPPAAGTAALVGSGGVYATAGASNSGETGARAGSDATTGLGASGMASHAGSGNSPPNGALAGVAGATSAGLKPLCPAPISKSKALLAAEPTPANPCARVSTAIRFGEAPNYAFAFTNGEIHVVAASNPQSSRRVDTWTASGEPMSLPRAIVTAMFAPQNNFSGSLTVGYADADATLSTWYAGRAGFSWILASRDYLGTVLGIVACPFHAGPEHKLLASAWDLEETNGSSYVFSSSTHLFNQHMQLKGVGSVSTVQVVGKSSSWQVIVGTTQGELYRSNSFFSVVTWDAAAEQLSKPITWERITADGMPAGWVTRIVANPEHQERLFALFGTNTGALWYSSDGGQSWSNRSNGLPTTGNTKLDPPLAGVSFNPFVDGAAYVVTSQTSYFTEDAGESWHEW